LQSSRPLRWGLRIATDLRFGAGHVARCAALARALPGLVEIFVDPASPTPGSLADFRCTAEASIEGSDRLLAAARGELAAIFDSPAVRATAIEAAAESAWTAAFRDGPPYGPEHVSIDCSPSAQGGARLLGGPTWMPLDPGLAAARKGARRAKRNMAAACRVLVAFGARDSADRTGTAAEVLMRLRADATIVLGRAYLGRDQIETLCARSPALRIVSDPADMLALYLSHDLAIGAPGVSQYERACCALPAILVAQNEQQVPLAAAWVARGCAVSAPATIDGLADAVQCLLDDGARRAALGAAAFDIVDGRGGERLAAALAERAMPALAR